MRLLGFCGLAFVVGLSGAMMPGPLLAVTIAQTARIGFSASVLITLGHALLEFVLVIAVVSGLGRLLRVPAVTRTIGVVGGGVLIFLAQGMIRSVLGETGPLPWQHAAHSNGLTASPLGLVGMGIWVSLCNPYWTLWWATVGMTFLTRALSYGRLGPGVFAVGHVSSDVAWYLVVGAIVFFGRTLMTRPIYNGVIYVCAVFLVGLGLYFLVSGIAPQLLARSRSGAES